jgi:hypothetical protein
VVLVAQELHDALSENTAVACADKQLVGFKHVVHAAEFLLFRESANNVVGSILIFPDQNFFLLATADDESIIEQK